MKANLSRRDIFQRLMDILRVRGAHNEVLTWSNAVLARDRSRMDALYNKAVALRKTGRCAESLKAYRLYSRRNRSDPDPYYGVALCLESTGDRAGAIQAYRTYIAKEKRPNLREWTQRARNRILALQGKRTSPRKKAPRSRVKIVYPKVGKLRGRVISAKTNEPIEGAIVSFPGKDLTSLVTDPDGTFLSYELSPGNHPVMIRKAGYRPGKIMALIKLGGVVNLDIKLTPSPPRWGTLAGKVVDPRGRAVSCTVILVGTDNRKVNTGANGEFSVRVKPGRYSVSFKARRFLRKRRFVRIIRGVVARVGIVLSNRPRRPLVRVNSGGVFVRGKIKFAGKTATLLPASRPALDSLVHALLENKTVTKLEIQGHTNNRGKLRRNMAISQARANVVRSYLLQNGIRSVRLIARGYGPRRPKRPNTSAHNRAMNDRIDFVVLEAR